LEWLEHGDSIQPFDCGGAGMSGAIPDRIASGDNEKLSQGDGELRQKAKLALRDAIAFLKRAYASSYSSRDGSDAAAPHTAMDNSVPEVVVPHNDDTAKERITFGATPAFYKDSSHTTAGHPPHSSEPGAGGYGNGVVPLLSRSNLQTLLQAKQLWNELSQRGLTTVSTSLVATAYDSSSQDHKTPLRIAVSDLLISSELTIPSILSTKSLSFDMTPIGTIQQRYILVKNPTATMIRVKLSAVDDECHYSVSPSQHIEDRTVFVQDSLHISHNVRVSQS
jgi:hypothetical protein